MKLVLGVDYFLFFEDFPHAGVSGVTALNTDGTVNIYINTLHSRDRQIHAIKHELRHVIYEHFYCDWMTIEEKEAEADRIGDDACIYAEDFSTVEFYGELHTPPTSPTKCSQDIVSASSPGNMQLFRSLDEMMLYLKRTNAQGGRKQSVGG